jgi:hypothetical protein
MRGGADSSARKPNIVFILADDLQDTSLYGSKYYEMAQRGAPGAPRRSEHSFSWLSSFLYEA